MDVLNRRTFLTRAVVLIFLTLLFVGVAGRVYAVAKWFSPFEGFSFADEDFWYFRGRWTQDSINEFDWTDAWEAELRGQNDLIGNVYYSGISDWDSDFPGKYIEFDPDDVTQGMHHPQNMQANTDYLAWAWLNPRPNQPASFPAFVESEHGLDFGCWFCDPWPQDREVLGNFDIPGFIDW